MRVVLTRLVDNGVQTLGELSVYDKEKSLFKCKTLELPWKDNENRISCIPTDDYKVKFRPAAESKSYDYDHYHVTDVPDRDWILIHGGNYHTQILGCILVGAGFTDINKDGELDVTNSRATLKKLMAILGESFTLEII